MKKTLFITMLAAALMGGQVFAEVTGTAVEGYDAEHSDSWSYYGKYSETDSVSGGNVTVKADVQGTVSPDASVYGGYADSDDGSATNNKVTMQGGTVSELVGGYADDNGQTSNNTVVMSGGQCNGIYGGRTEYGEVDGNVVIVTGGIVLGRMSTGRKADGKTNNGKVYLLGRGAANVTIADGQGLTSSYSYTGGNEGLSLGSVVVGYKSSGASAATGNALNIYGAGITAETMKEMQILTFNITNDQVVGATKGETMVNLTSEETTDCLNLEGVDLQINDFDVASWAPGATITLVESKVAIQGLSSEPQEVNIMRGGQVMAVGSLAVAGEGKLLQLTVPGSVPEPTTGTLSLLALAGLCVRRRRK